MSVKPSKKPPFEKVQSKLTAREDSKKKRAGAVLAAATRKASDKSKRTKRVPLADHLK